MRRCSACDLIYLEWVPEYGALYDEISWTRQHKKEEQRRLKAMPILARLDMWTRWRLGILGDATPAGGLNAWAKPGPVLDVGCSIGKGFDKLKGGRIPHGIEIDAKAAAIYAKAYNQDPEFYAFTRSLKAYRDSFADKKDVLVLSPDNEFFRYLEKSKP